MSHTFTKPRVYMQGISRRRRCRRRWRRRLCGGGAEEEAQWRFHQQRLAAQQRAKMRAQAALAMARAQQQATATAESCKRPREEGAGGALSKLDGDCITRS